MTATVREHLNVQPNLVWLEAAPKPRGKSKTAALRRQSAAATAQQQQQREPPFGLLEWLGDDSNSTAWSHFPLVARTSASQMERAMRSQLKWGPIDCLICISPEMDSSKLACHAAARVLQPKLIVVLLHRAQVFGRNTCWFLKKPPAPQQLWALAPHVALAAVNSQRMHGMDTVDWALPVAPFTPSTTCASKSCLRGFAIQGTLRRWSTLGASGLARNFSGLWPQMLHAGDAAVHLNITVLGRGERAELRVPPVLNSRVTFQSGLPYMEFWEEIYTSYALLPLFGNNWYLSMRISSTVLASLTTCVPIIATREFLKVYSFFRPEHVFQQEPGEDEVGAMLRVLRMDEAVIMAKRRALCELRQQLGQKAARLLLRGLAEAVTGYDAGCSAASAAG
ncbi:hypothetical protein TSOC_006819 [Tetrabaena socialis]|uniref:Uncharacterized protein n=1 Tax=Tetrabaena socialis TaxID=47790 RepID=A0A2J8A2L3_9CHLO|nr:hypothetical protein TSOC_006819 [Tetrabaena socialis]|eukprot:PNH06755.1 hypothetical protein TSOC_006819 [Tetrabaena socialis]